MVRYVSTKGSHLFSNIQLKSSSAEFNENLGWGYIQGYNAQVSQPIIELPAQDG
jgi:hypothetical protein